VLFVAQLGELTLTLLKSMEMETLHSECPVNADRPEIRLIEIQAQSSDILITCKFPRYRLGGCPPYVTLSYTWGDSQNYRDILGDDFRLLVRRNLWWFLHSTLKDTAANIFPEFWKSDRKSEDDRTVLEEALKEAWGTIPMSFFEELVESMERRVTACIKANGWNTKY
jgi:hypothetical protein